LVRKRTQKAATIADHFVSYQAWLKGAPLSEQSKRAYRGRISQFLDFLAAAENKFDPILTEPRVAQVALRDYKRYLKRSSKFAPSSVNASLTAINHFLQFMGLAPAKIDREDLPQEAPRALTPNEQKRYISTAQTRSRALDRAVPLLLINTGIRIGECAALDMADISIAGRKAQIIVRSGKGDRYREIPLNEVARDAVRDWILERNKRFINSKVDDALFLNPQGGRMSATSLDRIVRKVGTACGINLSAHILRHTCLTTLVRNGTDLVLVAEIGGHRRLETTRRYALPTKADKEEALEMLLD
jgi:integrase/recombinase XerC